MEILEINEIRLFDLMAERLFLDSIGYGNGLKMAIWLRVMVFRSVL